MAIILKPALRIMHGEAHLRFLPADAQLAEQTHKARIGTVIVDDKPSIDGIRALRRGDIYRGGMPTHRGFRFEKCDLMMSGQPPGTGEPCDTATDNGDVHERTILRNSLR